MVKSNQNPPSSNLLPDVSPSVRIFLVPVPAAAFPQCFPTFLHHSTSPASSSWILPGIISRMQVYEFAGKKIGSRNCISQILPVLWCFRGADGSSGKGFSWVLSFQALLLGKKRHFGKLLLLGNAVISVALLLTQHWGQMKEMEVLVWE